MKKNILDYLIKSILAGIMIGIGGTIFLSLEKTLGAFLFAIGLFMIVTRGYNLYTGKVGYIFDNKPSYLIAYHHYSAYPFSLKVQHFQHILKIHH